MLAPVTIALLMILWGTLATQSDERAADARWVWAPAGVGIVLALAVFMIDAWKALPNGRDAVLHVLPVTFNWPLFSLALSLMALPVIHRLLLWLAKTSASGPLPTLRSRTQTSAPSRGAG